MGDLNAKVGDDNTNRELIMGRHGVGTCNENGELFIDFCVFNDHVIGGTVFPHKIIHKTTWTSPDGQTENQIDHITVGRRWRRSLQDVRVRRGADAASDHQLLIAVFKIKLKSFIDTAGRPHHKFNTQYFKNKETQEIYNCEIKNKYEALSGLAEESVEEHWSTLKRIWKSTCTDVLGKRERKHKEWMTQETWAKIELRKGLKQKLNQCQDQQEKEGLRAKYWEANRQVKRSAREDKRRFTHELTEEAETAATQGNMKRLYEIIRTLSGKSVNSNKPVKDKNGKTITNDAEQRDRWMEHFEEMLNRPHPPSLPDIPPATAQLHVNTSPPTRTEIIKAIKSMKNGKVAGPDGIPPKH
ncbi:hypothetical protein C0Q70_14464 [Pomacea canaliculata]|uniref:Endonuclease/exonuclease/phosphatase domain-containing protein n=1 Tax=Pomacea canaliculata TaxID=400727 RepID=A0A2T7P057_POMCA|nr:hypothetical protein C0Q70_14464 [Pomacea canaliculata]